MLPIAVEPCARSRDVQALPVVGFRRQRLGRLHALDQFRLERLVGGGRQHAGAKRMRHRKVGMVGDDRIRRGQRVGLIGVQQLERVVQAIDRWLRGVRNGIAPFVEFGHIRLSMQIGGRDMSPKLPAPDHPLCGGGQKKSRPVRPAPHRWETIDNARGCGVEFPILPWTEGALAGRPHRLYQPQRARRPDASRSKGPNLL